MIKLNANSLSHLTITTIYTRLPTLKRVGIEVSCKRVALLCRLIPDSLQVQLQFLNDLLVLRVLLF